MKFQENLWRGSMWSIMLLSRRYNFRYFPQSLKNYNIITDYNYFTTFGPTTDFPD